MFKKTLFLYISAIFGQLLVAKYGQELSKTGIPIKAYIHAKTLHMSLFSGLYNHPLQIYNLEKNR